jgi:hypothetical protein
METGYRVASPPRFANVFWLGGGCGAGKTTLARAVTRRLDLRLYPVDAHTYDHLERSKGAEFPASRASATQSSAERWRQDPAELAQRFAAVAAERLALIRADLHALGEGPTIVAEGPQLLPALIAPMMQTTEHGLWLVPSADFGRRGVATRGGSFLSDDAQSKRYRRDLLLTEWNAHQATALGLQTLEVDGSLSLAETLEVVASRLRQLPGGLIRARDGLQRQRIRQAENAVAVHQLLSWWKDMGPEFMPQAPVFEFSCECETLGCDQVVRLPVTDYQRLASAGPVT